MKLTRFKNSIGKQLFSFFGWVGFFAFWYIFNIIGNFEGSGGDAAGFILAWSFIIIFGFISFSLIVVILELTFEHKIENKFLLENKIYNIFWILGALFSTLVILIFILGFLYSIYMIICA